MGSADVGQEAGTQAEQWLGTRGPPCQAELAPRAQGRGPESGWVIQACAGAGWLSDSAPPQPWAVWSQGVPEAGGAGASLLGQQEGWAWPGLTESALDSAPYIRALDRRKDQGRREGAQGLPASLQGVKPGTEGSDPWPGAPSTLPACFLGRPACTLRGLSSHLRVGGSPVASSLSAPDTWWQVWRRLEGFSDQGRLP